MAHRHARLAVLTLLSAAALVARPPVTLADPAPVAAADAQPYVGQVSGDDVLVRSGPSQGFYATQKLNKGDRVTVVAVRGATGEWLKIVPPEGSFCYVAQEYVERSPGNDATGRVRKPDLNVRAGSLLNGLRKTRLMTLNTDDPVQILGVTDDYYRIAPPPGAYLYVEKALVTPVPTAAAPAIPLAAQANDRDPVSSDPIPPARPAAVAVAPAVPTPPPAVPPSPPVAAARTPVAVTPATPMVPAVPMSPPAVAAAVPVTPTPVPALVPPPAVATAPPAVPTYVPPPAVDSAAMVAATPTTRPSADADAALASGRLSSPATTRPATVVAAAAPAATRPAVAELPPRERFERTEAEFARTARLPLDRRPLEGLSWRYKTLANTSALPASLRQVARSRMAALAVQIQARDQMADTAKSLADAAARQKGLEAERQELADRVKTMQVSTFAAVGTLSVSSLQQSGTKLYRLTDPNTTHTLLYVRSNDPKYDALLGQFIGVHGPVVYDAGLSLRYVTPTDAQVVDVAKVNHGIVAAFTPPSLVGTPATAGTGGL